MRVDVGELGLKQIYKFYCSKTKTPLSYTDFKEVCSMYGKIARRKVIDEGLVIPLPFRLGHIRVRKTQMNYKYMKFDYETFNKTGIKSFHMNDHSDDFKAKIQWDKSKCIVKGKLPYAFTFTRDWKRSLAAVMKSPGGHKRYFEDINKKS